MSSEKLVFESLDKEVNRVVHTGEIKVCTGGVIGCLLDKKDSVSFSHFFFLSL